ncbi:MAG TPA: pitrilysin family protein [Polyangia bacterium]|jgi:predicted Zn-dependent peptidase|nr:pitrilysin family protein [Polyangia bacterium]
MALATCALCFGLFGGAAARAQDLASFEKRTTIKVLPNGLTLIVVERPVAPVFSYYTRVAVGGAQEAVGQTGLAHMFEHMAFKGTDKIGTRDYAKEKLVLDKVERAYLAYDAERKKEVGRDEKKLAELEKSWRAAIAEADQYVVANQFGEIVDRSGGVGLNASTSTDATDYFFSMPSNRVELWAYLESERAKRPVMRQFYTERDVVFEERRLRTDSNPTGRLFEQYLAAAFTAHPYGRPVVGWPSDLTSFSATDAMRFWETYYTPANKCIAVVGDVKAGEVMPILEAYFGRLPKGPPPPPLVTEEPPQRAERMVVMREASQPFYIEGYHRPDLHDPDDVVFDAIADILSAGRTSRLYRALVRDKKLAVQVNALSSFPGRRYPGLFTFLAVPLSTSSAMEVREALHAEIERLKNEPVQADELRRVKARAKVNLLRGLQNNLGLAAAFATAQQDYGDWREVFRQVERIDRVTAEDVQRVARAVFAPSNRTAAWIETTSGQDRGKGQAQTKAQGGQP